MTRLELFRIKSMWGNYAFDYACSMARGLSGGLISIWDPNMFSKNSIWCDDSFIIIKGNWKNVVGDCFMVNIYGPQDHVSKLALWNRLTDFMHHHNGSYIMFGDMNAVRNAQERFGTTLNSIEADHFNSFIDSTGLVDLPIGGRSFTWMNKAGQYWYSTYLSIFRAPESVLQDLERIRAKFFWGGNKDENKMAWVKWPIILNSFDKGGLNIGSLKAFNLALLQILALEVAFLPQTPFGFRSSKLIMVKKEVSIQMVVASRAFGLTLLEPPIFSTRKIESSLRALVCYSGHLFAFLQCNVESANHVIFNATLLPICGARFFDGVIFLFFKLSSLDSSMIEIHRLA
ncbi:RNA-directed DNA polymerase, eukaryota, reverse transcriptase zinc-binding domain protein [Tanacetum coccineum]